MNMSLKNKLQKLKAKSESLTLREGTDDEVTIEVQGLTFNELTDVAQFSDKNDAKGASTYILKATLRKAVPSEGDDGMTDDEISALVESFDSKSAAAIIRKVQVLSGLLDEEKNLVGDDAE